MMKDGFLSVFLFTHNLGYTSSRPRNRRRKRAALSFDVSFVVVESGTSIGAFVVQASSSLYRSSGAISDLSPV